MHRLKQRSGPGLALPTPDIGRLSSDETTVTVHHPLKWTLAEKRDGEKFKTGHVLLFHGPTKEFACGDWPAAKRTLSKL